MEIEIEVISSSTTSDVNLDSSLEVEALQNVANKLEDLVDVDTSNLSDKYVIMYDAATQKYKLVNPDDILNAAAVTELTQPGFVGFATSFLNTLDTDLDNRIDVDAGTF
jgi:hypothetical protein